MSALAVTLRIARRDALRHKARSVLIVAMVAVPVLGLSAADVLSRTMQLSAGQRLDRTIGAADVSIEGSGGGTVRQGADPSIGYRPAGTSLDSGSARSVALRARALVIVGAKPGVSTIWQSSDEISAHGLQATVDTTNVDLASPLTAGIATVLSGSAPTAAGQVAVTPHLAHRLGLTIGQQVKLAGRVSTVTATVRDPQRLSGDGVYLPALSVASRLAPTIIAATDHPVAWSEVLALNHLGFAVASRQVIEHPPAGLPNFGSSNPLLSVDRVGLATVSIGLAILEVVLLAGAAFAVGARRQRRDLAVVGAAGGDAGHVARIVLAGGVVLGGVGAVLGLGLGVVVARISLSGVARIVGKEPGPFDVRPLELLGVLVLGALTGLIAAVLPARSAARDDVVAALTGRRGVVRTVKRVPLIGLVMIGIGVVLLGYAGRHGAFKELLVGATIAQLGFVVCAPTVVGLAGRLARFMPLAPRLALRDAARHRGRSGPAVAAVMAAIAGSIAVSTYFVSTVHENKVEYRPQSRIGQVVVKIEPGPQFAAQRSATFATVKQVLGGSLTEVPIASCAHLRGQCHYLLVPSTESSYNQLAVGDASLLRTLSGRTDPAAEAALAAGKFVVFTQPVLNGGVQEEGPNYGASKPLPGVSIYQMDVGKLDASFSGIVSTQEASTLHLGPQQGDEATFLTAVSKVPTQAQQDRLQDELPSSVQVIIGRPYSSDGYSAGLIILMIAAGIVTLGATAVSVGLSTAESKPDLVTLSAVGGRPRTRRALVASQAGTVSLLGALMGIAAGLLPAWAVLKATRGVKPFVLPWETMLVVVVVIPLLAMVGTAAFAGSRLVYERRA